MHIFFSMIKFKAQNVSVIACICVYMCIILYIYVSIIYCSRVTADGLMFVWHHGTISISDKASYPKISWSLEATRLAVCIITLQGGKLNFWSTRPKTDVPYMFYTKFHSPRPIFYSPRLKCTRFGERASISFRHCIIFKFDRLVSSSASWKCCLQRGIHFVQAAVC